MNKRSFIFSLIAVAAVSGLVGFAAGWVVKEKLDDKRFEEIREELEKDTPEEESSNDNVEKETVNGHDAAEDAIKRYSGVQVNPDRAKKPEKVVLTEEQVKKPDGPVVISVEEYEDEMDQDGWDKAEYRYYPSADLLVDDVANTRVMDYTYDVGSEALDILRNISEGSDGIVYVRNPYLGCDIMITVDWEEPNAEFYDVPDLNEMEGGVKG